MSKYTQFVQDVITFETSKKDANDVLDLICKSSLVFRNGDGLSGESIEQAVKEAFNTVYEWKQQDLF